jgi:mono/diheme cytochrome c family protein
MMKRLALMMVLGLAPGAHAEDVAEVWKAKCKSCHGEDGKAKTKMGEKEAIADMSLPAWQQAHSDDAIRDVIANGSPDNKRMKAFKDKLTPQQIDALVGYIRTMKAK